MYYIVGITEIINSIKQAIHVTAATADLQNNDLKNAYHQFLTQYSIFEQPITWNSIKLTNFNHLKKYCPQFCDKKATFYSGNTFLLTKRLASEYFETALLQLKHQHADIYHLAQFIIKIILINQLHSYTNGTTGETIGLASMDFKDHFQQQDFIELIVHQLTHMLLFIDDTTLPHIRKTNKEIMIETTLKYKLGGTQFPAYLAFHSYIVGVEIIAFRKETMTFDFQGEYHGSSYPMISACHAFQKSLMHHIDLFTPRGKYLLEKAFAIFSTLAKPINNKSLDFKIS